jgi:hypothetical protein
MKVVHCLREKYDVYIGRSSDKEKGKWGNPYSHKEGTLAEFRTNTRKEAIEAYREYILNGKGNHLLNDLSELEGKTLGCWCGNYTIEDKDNLHCHGQILLELLCTKRLF